MDQIFDVVYRFLKWLSEFTGFTYREINILVYFYFLPFLFIFLYERITKQNQLKIGFAILALISLLIIQDFEKFSSKAFDSAVVFLESFEFIGLDYIAASVVWCVIIPGILVIVLLYRAKQKQKAPLK
ncbi:MAG: hypothetical protein ABJW77_09710 [Gilvibacter sp.]